MTLVADARIFDGPIFKGGTVLRKLYDGDAGQFSAEPGTSIGNLPGPHF
jgi:predicted nucleotidyltransferase component of viral defense system